MAAGSTKDGVLTGKEYSATFIKHEKKDILPKTNKTIWESDVRLRQDRLYKFI